MRALSLLGPSRLLLALTASAIVGCAAAPGDEDGVANDEGAIITDVSKPVKKRDRLSYTDDQLAEVLAGATLKGSATPPMRFRASYKSGSKICDGAAHPGQAPCGNEALSLEKWDPALYGDPVVDTRAAFPQASIVSEVCRATDNFPTPGDWGSYDCHSDGGYLGHPFAQSCSAEFLFGGKSYKDRPRSVSKASDLPLPPGVEIVAYGTPLQSGPNARKLSKDSRRVFLYKREGKVVCADVFSPVSAAARDQRLTYDTMGISLDPQMLDLVEQFGLTGFRTIPPVTFSMDTLQFDNNGILSFTNPGYGTLRTRYGNIATLTLNSAPNIQGAVVNLAHEHEDAIGQFVGVTSLVKPASTPGGTPTLTQLPAGMAFLKDPAVSPLGDFWTAAGRPKAIYHFASGAVIEGENGDRAVIRMLNDKVGFVRPALGQRYELLERCDPHFACSAPAPSSTTQLPQQQ